MNGNIAVNGWPAANGSVNKERTYGLVYLIKSNFVVPNMNG